MPTKVVHVFSGEPYDVYIGRGRDPNSDKWGEYGNPYSHKEGTLARFKVDTVEEAVARHKADTLANQALVSKIRRELKNKTLGCWCNSPRRKDKTKLPCHGDTLAEIADSE